MMTSRPPHLMTTDERLQEVASILAKAIIRQEKRSKAEGSGEFSAGLHSEPKHACHDNKKQEYA